jgi:tripartite-type tricarboxylate transporter receptor subunit TctC
MIVRPLGVVLALATTWPATPLAAQPAWPTRTVKFITPFAAGGPTDTLARPVADYLTKTLGQPVIIENRAGGGTTIGAQAVVRAEPDGYTFLFGTNTPFALAPLFNTKAGYTSESLQPVILVATSPMVMAASIKSGHKTVAEAVEGARRNPAAYSFASVGATTSTHLLGEWMNQVAGLKMAHVPYRGSAPAMNDLVSGQVQVFFDVASSALPQHQANKIRILMVLDGKRSPLMPEVPTSAEVGYPQFIGTFWGGIGAPLKTPKPIVDRLNREVNAFLRQDEPFKALLARLTLTPAGGPPEDFATRIRNEAAIWKTVAEKAGFKPR